MKNEIRVFTSETFGSIRAMEISGEVWFVGKDVAEKLGYGEGKSPVNAVAKHVDEEDKGVTEMMTPGGMQKVTIINESGLYSLILGSRLPGAKAFKRWITAEVIPSIRRTGGYIKGQEELSDAELLAKALIVAQRQIKERERKLVEREHEIQQNAPKVLFADAVSASDSTILIGELAKILKQNGIETGQNRLFQTLREKNILIGRAGSDYNMPTQRAMELGLFRIKETAITHSDGHVSVNKTVKVTGKGQQYIINKFFTGKWKI